MSEGEQEDLWFMRKENAVVNTHICVVVSIGAHCCACIFSYFLSPSSRQHLTAVIPEAPEPITHTLLAGTLSDAILEI